MSLNDIQLNGATLASLYRDTLVAGYPAEPALKAVPVAPVDRTIADAGTGTPVPAAPAPPESIRSLGNNRRHILVLVSYPGTGFLPDEELQFLTKMLGACKLSLDDVAIVNRAHQPEAGARDYAARFSSRVVFLFGIEPLAFGLPVSFPLYQVQQVAQTTYLAAQALEDRDTDPQMKQRLWTALKRIFQL